MNIAFAGFRHPHIQALYALAIENKETRIAGCWEANDAAREDAECALNAEFRYASYDELLADQDVDAVAIGERYGVRGGLVIRALLAGKHVLSDKPLCTDRGELEEIERLCARTRLRIGMMLDLRCLPAVEPVRALLLSGEMGAVRSVQFGGQHPLLYGSRPSWYFDIGMHGGTLNDIAVHGLDLVAYLTGKHLSRVICAREWNAFAREVPTFVDSAQFMAVLDGDCALLGDVSYSAPSCGYALSQYWRFTLWCDGGVIEFCAKDKGYRIAKESEQGERFIECASPEGDCLTDFLADISGNPRALQTKTVLMASRDALLLQNAAKEKHGSDNRSL